MLFSFVRSCVVGILSLGSAVSLLAQAADEAPAPVLLKLTKAESVAVAAFAADMKATQKWLIDEQEAAAEKEARAHQLPVKLAARLNTVRVAGLPTELGKAFAALKSNHDAQAELYKDIPKDDVAIMEWIAQKTASEAFNNANNALFDARVELEQKLLEAGMACKIGREVDLYQTSELSQTKERWVVILGVYKTFESAKEDALKFAKASKVPFTMNGMIHDKKGLRYPDNYEDAAFAGQYISRSNNYGTVDGKDVEEHLSIEKSSDYQGFVPDFYIIVGNIAESQADAEKQVSRFKPVADGTYFKKTEIYLGCMH